MQKRCVIVGGAEVKAIIEFSLPQGIEVTTEQIEQWIEDNTFIAISNTDYQNNPLREYRFEADYVEVQK